MRYFTDSYDTKHYFHTYFIDQITKAEEGRKDQNHIALNEKAKTSSLFLNHYTVPHTNITYTHSSPCPFLPFLTRIIKSEHKWLSPGSRHWNNNFYNLSGKPSNYDFTIYNTVLSPRKKKEGNIEYYSRDLCYIYYPFNPQTILVKYYSYFTDKF